MSRKSYDYKLTAVQYYLVEDKTQEEVCKIFRATRILNADFISFYISLMSFFLYISCYSVYFYSNLYYKHK